MMRSMALALISSCSFIAGYGQCVIGNSVAPSTENGNNLLGQSFTATCAGTIEYVEIICSSTGTNTAGTLKIYTGSSVLGTPIHTQAYTAAPVAAGSPFRVYLSTPINVMAGNQRTFEMEISLDVAYSGSNPYSGGRMFYNGSNSSVYAQIDLHFNVSIASNCTNTSASITADACQEYISPSGNSWTSTGLYTDTIPNMQGCDSIISIDLTVVQVDTSVTLNGMQLTANEANAAYQWLDCDNANQAIVGADQQSYTPTTSGNYAVEITANGCVVESACQFVGSTSITENASVRVHVWPNPSAGILYVSGLESDASIAITDVMGRSVAFDRNMDRSILTNAVPGMYLLRYTDGKGQEGSVLFLLE